MTFTGIAIKSKCLVVLVMLTQCWLLLAVGSMVQQSNTHEIYTRILTGYNRNVRPVVNDSTTVMVRMQPTLYSIDKVSSKLENLQVNNYQDEISYLQDEVIEKITINYWQILYWTDELLVWDPNEYGGVKKIQLPAAHIWKPDIFVYGMSLKEDHPHLDEVLAVIDYQGNVRLSSNQFLTVACEFNISPFPFDTQNCTVRFGSWSYDGNQVDVYTDGTSADISQFNSNTEWELKSFNCQRFAPEFDNRTWPEMQYYLVIKRDPTYYLLTQVTPTAVITALSFIGLFSPFSSHGERQEKVTMGLTTLLTMAVVLTVVSSQMPKTSSGLPLVGEYIIKEIVLAATASMITVCMMYLEKYAMISDAEVPRYLRSITFMSSTMGKKIPAATDGLAMINIGVIKNIHDMVNGHTHLATDGLAMINIGVTKNIHDMVNGHTHLEVQSELMLAKLLYDVRKLREHVDKQYVNQLRLDAWNVVTQRLDLWLMLIFESINLFFTAEICLYDGF